MVYQGYFVLEFPDHVLVVLELHVGDLVLLAFLSQVVDFSVPAIHNLSAFSDLVLKTGSLILESDGNLPDLPVDHALPLGLHHVPQLLEFFSLAFIEC